jgi:hypothetical protein
LAQLRVRISICLGTGGLGKLSQQIGILEVQRTALAKERCKSLIDPLKVRQTTKHWRDVLGK